MMMSSSNDKGRVGRLTYEPELDKDNFERWLEQQRDNATTYTSKKAFSDALHGYKVLARAQHPIFVPEEPES